jgi:photosystem II stability/assembly factor-like uncharacterized protein
VPNLRPHIHRAAQWFARLAIGVLWCVTPAPAGGAQSWRMTDDLFGSSLVSAKEGWVVGGFGTIYHTTDGGSTWRPQVSNSTEQLFSVAFADAKTGWIVGRSGLVLATTNGGDTWKPQTSGTPNHLFQVKALDTQHVWAVGDWGTVLYTQDGGKTWENRSLTRDVILNGLSWADSQHGWIVGEAGTILATTDGGATWTEQHSGVEKTLFGVFFANPQQGWATGIDGLILHTTDGGQTWQVQHGDVEVGALEQVGFADTLGNPSLYDIAVVGKTGYAVGENGAVFASDDGGQTWHRKPVPGDTTLRWMRTLSMVSGTHGVFAGAHGLTVRVVGDHITSSEQDEHATQAVH